MRERIELMTVPTLLITSLNENGRLQTPPNLLNQLGAISCSAVARLGFGSLAMRRENIYANGTIETSWVISINRPAMNQLLEPQRQAYVQANERFRDFLVRNQIRAVIEYQNH